MMFVLLLLEFWFFFPPDLTTVVESTCGFEMGEECVLENDDFADFNWETNDVSYDKDTNTGFHCWTYFFYLILKKSGK